MQAVKAYYDGDKFVPIETIKVKRNQTAIITILDESLTEKKKAKPFEKFVGKLSDESYVEISEALNETERVEVNEW